MSLEWRRDMLGAAQERQHRLVPEPSGRSWQKLRPPSLKVMPSSHKDPPAAYTPDGPEEEQGTAAPSRLTQHRPEGPGRGTWARRRNKKAPVPKRKT